MELLLLQDTFSGSPGLHKTLLCFLTSLCISTCHGTDRPELCLFMSQFSQMAWKLLGLYSSTSMCWKNDGWIDEGMNKWLKMFKCWACVKLDSASVEVLEKHWEWKLGPQVSIQPTIMMRMSNIQGKPYILEKIVDGEYNLIDSIKFDKNIAWDGNER